MKKMINVFLSIGLLLSFNMMQKVDVHAQQNADGSCCNIAQFPLVEKVEINENGNVVRLYDDGAYVEIINENTVIVRDYKHVLSDDAFVNATSSSWQNIGVAILTYISYVLSGCQSIQYLTGHDICRIVLNYITSKDTGSYRYLLTGRYIPGYIPGCEPRDSLPCNSGYWEYKVVLQ
ncbi:hypothetical protein [Anaerolactibacter massiliensis]|uniref:hypothetical protein n=1 Tax=Anaerolactibacter massiliensis TaxID=2044573 RepID=UPI00107F09EE|nr:hypothetical protein [Anaerolactibacter massiliensis]